MNQESTTHKTFEAKQFWLPLDNAAKIFPASLNEEVTTVIRLTAVLKKAVKIKPLMKAISRIEKRFPYYKVQLLKGFFWYYLEYNPLQFPIEVDNKRPCRKFPKNGLLTRILVKDNRLSVEFSHILTDGSGAFQFLKTILTLYSEECGANIPDEFPFYRPDDEISEEEYEDAYNRYFKEEIPPAVKRSKAFHLPWPLNPKPRLEVLNAILSISQIKPKAKEKGVTITDYLIGVYLYVLQQIYEETHQFSRHKKNKVLRLEVPVDLRNIFPSKTMRNFTLFVMPEIDLRLGHYSFDEIVRRVYHQMRLETDEKLINKNISRNVGSEKKIYVKSIPLVIKSLILKAKYYSLGASQYSGVITNLGKVTLPEETEKMVDYFIFTPPPPNKMLKVNSGIIGFGDKLVISFGNITKSKELEEKIFNFLEDQGIEATFENQ
jgi:NRPS condensation-like uncharacterized protein